MCDKNSYVFHMNQLKGEYLQTMKKAELYGQVRRIDSDEYEEMMMELLDLLTAAQENGKPAEMIVGDNMEEFCRSYFGVYTWKDRLKSLPKQYVILAWIIAVLELLELPAAWRDAKDAVSVFSVQTDISGYLGGFILAWMAGGVLDVIFRPLVFRMKKLTQEFYQVIAAALLGLLLLIVIISGITEQLQVTVPALLVISGALCYLLAYYGVCIFKNYKRYGVFRKPKNTEADSYSFKQQVKQQVERELPGELKKRFEKKNRKLAKRGKEMQTPQAYMEKLRREAKMSERICIIGMGLVFLICLGIGIVDIVMENLKEGLQTFGIMLVAEIPAWFVFILLFKANRCKENLLNRCDKMEIDVIEYADME